MPSKLLIGSVRRLGLQKDLSFWKKNRVKHSGLCFCTRVIMVCSPKIEDHRVSPKDLSDYTQVLNVFVIDPDKHTIKTH